MTKPVESKFHRERVFGLGVVAAFVITVALSTVPAVAQEPSVVGADASAEMGLRSGAPLVVGPGSHRRVVAELATGASSIGLGALVWAGIDSSDPVQLTIISSSAILLGTGTFELLHGGARLRVQRALLRGEPLERLRASERRRGRRQMILGSSLLVGGLGFSMVGFAGQDGGPNPVFAITFFGVGGATGTVGLFYMSHAIYRLHFGRHGTTDRVAWAPDVHVVRGGFTLGFAGRL